MSDAFKPYISSRLHHILLVLLVILACMERIYGIDRQGLWSDELFAVMASYKDHFKDIWPLLVDDSHPPGYVALMYWLIPLTGYSDTGIRLHALVFGILWVPLVFWIGKRWISAEAGLLAATLVTSTYSAIYFSQEARAYSMLVAFHLVNLICYLEILFGNKSQRCFIAGFIITSIITLYLHYSGFVFLATEALFYLLLWASRHRQGSWRETGMVFGLPLLAFSPWMGLMVNHLTDTSHHWAVTAKPTLTDVHYALLYLWGFHHYYLRAYLCSLALAVCWAVYCHIKHDTSHLCAIIFALIFLVIVPTLAFYVESIVWTPIFEKRYFLVSTPLIAIIMAMVISQALRYFVSPPWQTLFLLFLILLITMGSIRSNIQQQLYSRIDKEPVREAVDVIRRDIAHLPPDKHYTVIASHDWFEHYLRRAYIPITAHFTYDMPDQIRRIDHYFNSRPDIAVFYYLSFNLDARPRSEAAIMALTQQYKLLSKAQTPFLTGAIDIYKFSSKDAPDSDGPGNAVGKFLLQETKQKNPGSYTILMTHHWVEAQLRRNHVDFDENWPRRQYDLDIEGGEVAAYLHDHPAIDTLYYIVRRDPKNDSAIEMLEWQYQLTSQHSVESTIGTMDIYTFNTKITPPVTDAIKIALADNPVNIATGFVDTYVNHADPGSYAIIMTHSWFQPYLHLRGLHVDENWDGRIHGADFQVERVFSYLNQHPAVDDLYYLALRDGNAENGLLPLLLKYPLVSCDTVNSPSGKLEIFHFKTKGKRPLDTGIYEAEFNKSPINMASVAVASDIGKGDPARYLILTSHQWFNLYLRKQGLDVDRAWPGHLVNSGEQVDEVFNYVSSHPAVVDLYYVAYREPGEEAAATKLQAHYPLISKKTLPTAISHIDIYHFNVRSTTSSP